MAQTLGVAGRAIEHERTKFGKIEFTWMGLERYVLIKTQFMVSSNVH